jgi:hypothetical protein
VTVSTDSAKKPDEITAEGRAFLDANRRAVDALLARMVETSRAHAARLLTARRPGGDGCARGVARPHQVRSARPGSASLQ